MAMTMLRVSQLNRYVKSQLDADARLQEVFVKGEIATLSPNIRSGHLYFTLRDDMAAVRCVMFAKNVEFLRFLPEPGMAVIAHGTVTLYERDGSFQINVSELLPDGAGAVGNALALRKQKLTEEGLFAAERKRPIPQATMIGVVTSASGAALHDIREVIAQRNPAATILFSPAVVQGEAAPASIAAAIAALHRDGRAEVLIVGRGGGSTEDLEAFQSELVVRAVAGSAIPVISAVGHETDVTLCDFAADLRAATPSAAAMLAVADTTEQLRRLAQLQGQLRGQMTLRYQQIAARLTQQTTLLSQRQPLQRLTIQQKRFEQCRTFLAADSARRLTRYQQALGQAAFSLEALSPLAVLSRGYALVQTGDTVVTSTKQLAVGQAISLRLQDGSATAIITAAQKGDLI